MAIEMRLDLKLAQKLVMTPQLQQAIKLLQLSRLELSQMVYQEMLENPVLEDASVDLETEEPDTRVKEESETATEGETEQAIDVFDMKWDNYLDEDEDRQEMNFYSDSEDEKPSYEQTLSQRLNLADHLTWQLRLTAQTELENRVGDIIIGNIDDDGYLRDVTVPEIAAGSGVREEYVERILKTVQDFDPPGVGARNLQECLLIQARQLALTGTLVEEILLHYLDDLEKKRYQAIARGLKVTLKDVQLTAKVIESLEPRPGRPFSANEVQYIMPDVFVVKKEGEYVVLLNDEGIPRLRISPFYKNLMRLGGDDNTKEYIESKLRSAQWLIKSIEQRNKTIFRVAESIVKRQREFFDFGLERLRPMILKDVADDIQMHESTISRVTTNKYMHTPMGIYELKYFFSGGISSMDGDSLSSISVRNLIHKTISEEDPKNPLNDRQIVNLLRKKNIEIARRTVSKYRGELKIPPASVRKKPY